MENSKIQAVMHLIQKSFNKDDIKGINSSVQLDLLGENGGQWFISIKNQGLSIQEGVFEEARANLELEADDFLEILSGKLDPLKAFFMGRVKISGDRSIVMKLISLLHVSEEEFKDLEI